MIFLSFDTLGLVFNFISPLLFLYTLSSIHEKNQDFTAADFFSSNIYFFGGKTFGTFLTKTFIRKFGFKPMLISAGILYLIAFELLRKTSSIIPICLSKLC